MHAVRTPNSLREYLRKNADNYVGARVSPGIRGVVIGRLNDICGGDDMRRLFLSWVFGDGERKPLSSKHLDDAKINALFVWMETHQEDGVWQHSVAFEYELKQAMITVRHWAGFRQLF